MPIDHDDAIIPKPQAMKRISHMGLPRNASHLIQGLSALLLHHRLPLVAQANSLPIDLAF